MVSNSLAGTSNFSEMTFGGLNKSSPGAAAPGSLPAPVAAGVINSPKAQQQIAMSRSGLIDLWVVKVDFIMIETVMGCNVMGTARVRPVKDAEHWIPGRSQQRDLHRGEAVQALLGFRLEEHRERIAAALLSGEDLISIQLPAQTAHRQ